MNSQATAGLAQRFGIAGKAEIVRGEGGLPKLVVSTAGATGEMYLHGAHVTSWKPRDKADVLYLSPNSLFQADHAIRGGIPVCFPWFGDKGDDPTAPAHGFVRTREWQLESVQLTGNDDVAVTMLTQSDDSTRRWWPFAFRLLSRVTFGGQLKVELVVTNTGSSAFSFEEALHAYFAVTDSSTAIVRGLDATDYIDKTDGRKQKMQRGDVDFSGETDRVYLDTMQDLQLFDPESRRCINVQKRDSRATVVWNPGSEKSAALKDLGGGEWKKFVCIETANVSPFAVHLQPDQSHTLGMVVRVEHFE